MGRADSSSGRPSIWKRPVVRVRLPERDRVAERGRAHLGIRLELPHQLLAEAAHLLVGVVLGPVERDAGGQHVLGAEAGIDLLQLPEAAQHQAGGDQQHEGEGDLRDHQQAARAPRAEARRRARELSCFITSASSGRAVSAGSAPNSMPVSTETTSVKPSTVASMPTSLARVVKRAVKATSRWSAAAARPRPISAAGDRQQRALGQQLAHEPAAPGAERRAHRELAAAPQHARQHQVRDVRAGDQQHAADGAQQHEQRRPRAQRQLVAEAHRRRGEARALRVGIRVVGREAGGDRGQVGAWPARASRPAAAGRRRSASGRRGSRASARSSGTGRPSSACRRRSRSGTAARSAARPPRCAGGCSSGTPCRRRSGRRRGGAASSRSSASGPRRRRACRRPARKLRPRSGVTPRTSKKSGGDDARLHALRPRRRRAA